MIFLAARGVRLIPRFRSLPQGFRRLERRSVDAARRGDAGGPSFVRLLEVDAPDRDPAHPALLEPGGERQRRAPVRQLVDEPADLVAGDAARDRDLLDVALAQVPREPDQHRGRPEEPLRVDDDLVVDEPDDDGVLVLQRGLRQRRQGVDAAPDERVLRRIQRRAAYRGGQPAHQLLVDPGISHGPAENRPPPARSFATGGRRCWPRRQSPSPRRPSRFAAARRSSAA